MLNCVYVSPLLSPQGAFLVYCMAPTASNGSILIYTRIIRPVFLKNEGKIDDAMKIVKDKATEAADKFKDEGERIYWKHTRDEMVRF